jgi:hypothetical protein
MKQITVVTTFHQKGLEVYGQKFLDSFAANVSKKIKMIVYAEDCDPINPDSDQIQILDAKQSLPELVNFKEKWSAVPKANGECPPKIKARRPRDWNKKFKWDAIRFANKVYAVFDAWEKNSDWVVWIDADVFVHSEISHKEFSNLLPDNAWITYVGRGKGSQTWPECGFYGMNKKHPVCHEFIKKFKDMYDQAEQGIFTLEEWHDSYVFGHLLNTDFRQFKDSQYDYAEEMYLKHAKTGGGGHPFINCVLGKYFDHMQGDRKFSGKSKASDLQVMRQEDYWRSAK